MNLQTNISEEELSLIESYLFNNLPPHEQASFSSRLLNDTDLQAKVEEIRLLMLGVNEAVLQDKLNAFHHELPAHVKNRPPSKITLLNRWLVAAAVIIVIAVGSWLLLNRSTTEEKIFTAYYKPDPGMITAMSTSDNYTFDRAMIDYKTGNYDSAIKAWESLLALEPGNDTLNYFIGSSYLALNKNEKAIPHLQKVITVSNSYFLKDAYWYLGLLLLKEGKRAEAVSLIKKSEHEKSGELLLKLKNNP